MSRLKTENVKKCISILQTFVDEASSLDSQKRTAVLALDQLQKITAGTDPSDPSNPPLGTINCAGKPRAY